MTEAIQKILNVPMRPKDAFALFTDHLANWWPTESHSLSAADGELPKDVKVEQREGGHIIETKADGETGRWGTITRWEPGNALGVSWYVGRPEDEATDLLIVFTPTDTGTRIELTHDGFDRLADKSMHENYNKGWDLVLITRFGGYATDNVKNLLKDS